MPVLPLIDLMLLSGWTALLIGFVLKMVYLTTNLRPTIASLTPIDFLMVAIASMLFAIALAARTWVASQSPARTARRRRDETMAAYLALQDDRSGRGGHDEGAAGGSDGEEGASAGWNGSAADGLGAETPRRD